MSPKKQTRLSGNFVRAVEQELANPERDAVAIMSLNLGCPHDLFCPHTGASAARNRRLITSFCPGF